MLTQADVHWIELDSVDSTNDFLTRAYQQGRVSGHVAVLAHSQTAGRGRAGRSWQAAAGSSLCLSIGLPIAGHSLPFLPLCVGVAVARHLEALAVPVRLKWPNDFLIGSQKLGGVLCESFQSEAGAVTIVGLGLNIHPLSVPQALSGHGSVSLAQHMPGIEPPTARNLAEKLVPAILASIQAAQQDGISSIFNEFAQRDAWLGREVQIIEQGLVVTHGTAMGIDEHGAYLVNTARGLQAINSGDLSLRAVS